MMYQSMRRGASNPNLGAFPPPQAAGQGMAPRQPMFQQAQQRPQYAAPMAPQATAPTPAPMPQSRGCQGQSAPQRAPAPAPQYAQAPARQSVQPQCAPAPMQYAQAPAQPQAQQYAAAPAPMQPQPQQAPAPQFGFGMPQGGGQAQAARPQRRKNQFLLRKFKEFDAQDPAVFGQIRAGMAQDCRDKRVRISCCLYGGVYFLRFPYDPSQSFSDYIRDKYGAEFYKGAKVRITDMNGQMRDSFAARMWTVEEGKIQAVWADMQQASAPSGLRLPDGTAYQFPRPQRRTWQG